jgi:hypothetical protein
MKPEITDHALVRWLERVKGVDLQPYRDEIAAAVDGAVRVGATKAVIDGNTYVLDGHRVCTIIDGYMKPYTERGGYRPRKARRA